MKSIDYGVQNISGSFDRRPNKGSEKPTYVKGKDGASKTSGATQKKGQGLTGNSHGSGKNSYGKPGAQKYGQ